MKHTLGKSHTYQRTNRNVLTMSFRHDGLLHMKLVPIKMFVIQYLTLK